MNHSISDGGTIALSDRAITAAVYLMSVPVHGTGGRIASSVISGRRWPLGGRSGVVREFTVEPRSRLLLAFQVAFSPHTAWTNRRCWTSLRPCHAHGPASIHPTTTMLITHIARNAVRITRHPLPTPTVVRL